MKKLIGCLAAFLCLFSTAYAYSPISIHVETYAVRQGSIDVYFNSNKEEKITQNQLSVTLGGTPLGIRSLERFGDTDQGTAFILLADISGSIQEDKLSQMKDIMSKFAASMGKNDSGCVMTAGNDAGINPFVSDKQKLALQIENVKRTSQNTNLYASIVKALGALNTANSAQTKKYLIVLSDGRDNYTTGYTREEVEKAIEGAHLPVYTVAMLDAKSSRAAIDASKILGSFARVSAGGLDITYGLDRSTSESIAKRIRDSIGNGYILHADLSALTAIQNPSYLQLSINAEGQGKASDGYGINTSEIQAQIQEKPHTTIPPSTPAQTAAPSSGTAAPGIRSNTLLVIIIPAVVGAAAIAITVTFIVIHRKRKKRLASGGNPLPANTLDPDPTSATGREALARDLRFTKVGASEGEAYTYRLRSEMTIGRNGAKSQLAFPKDELLSGQHCRIYQKGDKLFIEDLHSTNGTHLNGIPVQAPHSLEQDDIISVGSMELRISWK